MNTSSPTWQRLEDQINWYDRKSQTQQRWFKRLKLIQIVTAALVPLSAGLQAPATLTGGLGVLIVILEGLQSLNQYQQSWITYRSTCEQLKHEKYLCLAQAGPYAASQTPEAVLAERVESLISREHAQWISAQERQEGEKK